MKNKKFNLGLGPMSFDIINLLLEYSYIHEYPIYLIASRNQVDYNKGYVCDTATLSKFVTTNKFYDNERVVLCRDHCGPYFSNSDSNLNLTDAVNECLNTIRADIQNNFKYIHIDVGRVKNVNYFDIAKILIDECLKLDKNIKLEFGSEENIGIISGTSDKLIQDCKFLELYKPNIEYFVSQTGSLTKHKQVGVFDLDNVKEIVKFVHNSGFKFKEHNADYLNSNDLKLRKEAQIDAVNVAPQLGYIQSEVLLQMINKDILEKFYNKVLDSKIYEKWVTVDVNDNDTKFLVSAHYMFGTPEYKELFDKIDKSNFNEMLKQRIFEMMDTYRLGLE